MPTLFMPTLVMPTLFKSQTLSCHRDSSRALGPKRSILAARYAVALILGANLLVSTASAQDAGDESSTVIYAADYFDQWQPITAQDMLDRIPGQGAAGGPSSGPSSIPGNPETGGRGLGGGGGNQVLINGKRIAGKNNSTSEQLDRIPRHSGSRIPDHPRHLGRPRCARQRPDSERHSDRGYCVQ